MGAHYDPEVASSRNTNPHVPPMSTMRSLIKPQRPFHKPPLLSLPPLFPPSLFSSPLSPSPLFSSFAPDVTLGCRSFIHPPSSSPEVAPFPPIFEPRLPESPTLVVISSRAAFILPWTASFSIGHLHPTTLPLLALHISVPILATPTSKPAVAPSPALHLSHI
ncbi:uncharacterized protein EI97DRAFT_75143 [Westerdykella ornata]|uniref:Uncharacterized protein n=1 Tax=Westerdykella ornata TaxID=318751 RepID=A0A6A6JHL5_WESOR|nr:uncharacterized protein EI97DRAFT_75143 [Westerdykella ornata]KAF2275448.1 hypothetical protein EI97DRAFT_75143 [Westerdykella ornata]